MYYSHGKLSFWLGWTVFYWFLQSEVVVLAVFYCFAVREGGLVEVLVS